MSIAESINLKVLSIYIFLHLQIMQFYKFLPRAFIYCCCTLLTWAYLRGGVQGVQTPPPPRNFQIFFLKSEGKATERKRKKDVVGEGGGSYLLTYIWGWFFFEWGWDIFRGGWGIFLGDEKFSGSWEIFGGLRNFRGGWEIFGGGGLRNFRGGLRNFRGDWEIFAGGGGGWCGWEIFGGVEKFSWGVEKFSVKLNVTFWNFRGEGWEIFGGGGVRNYRGGGLRNYRGGGLRNFRRCGWEIFGGGLRNFRGG